MLVKLAWTADVLATAAEYTTCLRFVQRPRVAAQGPLRRSPAARTLWQRWVGPGSCRQYVRLQRRRRVSHGRDHRAVDCPPRRSPMDAT